MSNTHTIRDRCADCLAPLIGTERGICTSCAFWWARGMRPPVVSLNWPRRPINGERG